MKKILTLLLAAGAFITVQAQSKEEARRVILGGNGSGNNGSNRDRDVILGGGNNGDTYPSYPGSTSSRDRQSQIDQVNREYDNKIQSIRNNSYLSYEEKQRAIRQLEKDRQARIKQINKSYDRNGRYDDDRDRYEKRNNGKHKGWNKKAKNKNWKKGNRDRDDD